MIGRQADSSANCRFNSHQIGKSRNENGAMNPRHFFAQNSAEKGFFYSFNVEHEFGRTPTQHLKLVIHLQVVDLHDLLGSRRFTRSRRGRLTRHPSPLVQPPSCQKALAIDFYLISGLVSTY